MTEATDRRDASAELSGDAIRSDAVSAACREPARLRGKHGADLNLAVPHRRRAPHRAGHECRISIPPNAAFVYDASALLDSQNPSRAGCFCAWAAAVRSSSVVAATAARSIAAATARGGHAGSPCEPPRNATRRAFPAGGPMPSG